MIRAALWLGSDPAVQASGRALARFLGSHDWLNVETASDGAAPDGLGAVDVVLSAGSRLDERAAAELARFVERGGGLVAFVGHDPAWREEPLWSLLAVSPEVWRPTPETELLVRVAAPDHPITRRVESTFPVVSPACLLPAPGGLPGDATALLETSWHYQRHAVAYTRRHAGGRVVAIGWEPTAGLLDLAITRQLTYRAVRYLAGAEGLSTTAVAMIGYGAIGREHAEAIQRVPGLELAAVCDRNPERRVEAEQLFPGARTYARLSDVLEDPSLDLAIVSTPPNTHAEVAAQLLRAGKHVVVEKPFCLTSREADELIAIARDQQRLLTVYQNRRWDPDFQAIRHAIRQGAIGDVFHLEAFVGGYGHPCDYWHSHEAISGGVFYDWGSHYVDWILNLVPDRVTSVTASVHKRVWHDVTNADQARITIRFAGGAEADFIHSDIAAALKPKWYILGTRGAIVAEWRHETIKSRRWSGDLVEERLAAAEALPVVTVHTRDAANSIHVQQLGLAPPPDFPFHRNLANHLHDGEQPAVTAESARRNVAVLEAAKYSAEHGSRPVELDC